MDINKLTSARKLNAWILTHFTCLEASSAYVEFPFQIIAEGKTLDTVKRIVYVTLALKGLEELCCKEIAEGLRTCISKEVFQDCCGLLLVRTWFNYNTEENTLFGRLAFYDYKSQDKLAKARFIKREGELPRAVLPKEES